MSNSGYIAYLQSVAVQNSSTLNVNEMSLASIASRVEALTADIARLSSQAVALQAENGKLAASNVLIASLIQYLQSNAK